MKNQINIDLTLNFDFYQNFFYFRKNENFYFSILDSFNDINNKLNFGKEFKKYFKYFKNKDKELMYYVNTDKILFMKSFYIALFNFISLYKYICSIDKDYYLDCYYKYLRTVKLYLNINIILNLYIYLNLKNKLYYNIFKYGYSLYKKNIYITLFIYIYINKLKYFDNVSNKYLNVKLYLYKILNKYFNNDKKNINLNKIFILNKYK